MEKVHGKGTDTQVVSHFGSRRGTEVFLTLLLVVSRFPPLHLLLLLYGYSTACVYLDKPAASSSCGVPRLVLLLGGGRAGGLSGPKSTIFNSVGLRIYRFLFHFD